MEVKIQPMFHLPSQVPMEICLPRGGAFYLFSQRLLVSPVPAVSCHCVTLDKVICLSDFGFPFEKLSSIKQRFNPEG